MGHRCAQGGKLILERAIYFSLGPRNIVAKCFTEEEEFESLLTLTIDGGECMQSGTRSGSLNNGSSLN